MSTEFEIPKRQLIIAPLFKANKTLVVFIATVAAYAIALLSEIYVLSLYGIGPDMVELSPYTLLIGLAGLVAAYIILEVWTEIYYQIVLSGKKIKHEGKLWLRLVNDFFQAAFLLFTTYALIILQFVYYSNDLSSASKIYNVWTIPLGMLVLLLFISTSPFIANAFSKKRLPWKNVLEAFYKKADKRNAKIESEKKKTQNVYTRFVDSTILNLIVLIFVIFTITTTFAALYTRTSHNYYVLDSDNTIKTLIVRHYSDTVLAKDYDTKTHKFQDGFKVIKIDDNLSLKESYRVPAWKNKRD